MGSHLIDGQFKSDKYLWAQPGFVPLKVTDQAAQPFLYAYAQVHRAIDPEFSDDLEQALKLAGYTPPQTPRHLEAKALQLLLRLTYLVYVAMDDSEQLEDDSHKLDHANVVKICAALDRLDTLPDDQPGYTMGPAAMARWHLRRLTAELGVDEEGEVENCIACDMPMAVGDKYYPDASGGALHAECCGPERECYTRHDEPLKDADPIPEPFTWGEVRP